MTLTQLTYFQTVARCQHFRLAASELNISQPSLSRSIANLEEELGIVLFERHGRNVTLTRYGRLFLSHADRILSEVAIAGETDEETFRKRRPCRYRICLPARCQVYSSYGSAVSGDRKE